MKYISIFVSLVISVFLAGCVFYPETINIKPQLNSSSYINIGHGQKIAVQVTDSRQDEKIGQRPSYLGPQADINISSNFLEQISNSISDGLKNKGFVPDSQIYNSPKLLKVRLILLEYNVVQHVQTLEISTHCVIEATYQSKNESYKKVYHSEIEHTVLVVPMTLQDENYINEALSGAINNMVNDQKLLQIMAK